MWRKRQEVLELAALRGLQLNDENFKINDSGLDFQVAFATDQAGVDWVLRMPRRAGAFEKTKLEKIVLDLLKKKASFEVPNWELYLPDLIAYKALKGTPAGTINPATSRYVWEINQKKLPKVFVDSFAKALVELHKLPLTEVEAAGIAIRDMAAVREDMSNRMDAVKKEFGVGESLWDRWQSWLENDDLWPETSCLVHGDLHPGHTMIKKSGEVTGLIDWTEAKVGDLTKDFVGFYRVFGEASLDKLIEAYTQAGGYTWPKIKEHVIEMNTTYGLEVAEFAMEIDSDDYKQAARRELGFYDL